MTALPYRRSRIVGILALLLALAIPIATEFDVQSGRHRSGRWRSGAGERRPGRQRQPARRAVLCRNGAHQRGRRLDRRCARRSLYRRYRRHRLVSGQCLRPSRLHALRLSGECRWRGQSRRRGDHDRQCQPPLGTRHQLCRVARHSERRHGQHHRLGAERLYPAHLQRHHRLVGQPVHLDHRRNDLRDRGRWPAQSALRPGYQLFGADGHADRRQPDHHRRAAPTASIR